jgi:2-amino-4-hydroxy-6-hydroxymethyldihydropteridine diphosphokinase
MKVGVALGSNLGDRLQNFRAACQAVTNLTGVAPPVSISPIYETEPIDCEAGAPQFFNAVLEFNYKGEPLDLLRELKRIEAELGRGGDPRRNVSREIDIDLLYFGDRVISNEKLQLPHPRMQMRRFVLQPLADIHPDLVLPNQTRTVRELLASLDQSDKVERVTTDWNFR